MINPGHNCTVLTWLKNSKNPVTVPHRNGISFSPCPDVTSRRMQQHYNGGHWDKFVFAHLQVIVICLYFVSQLKETKSKLKGENTLHYNDEEAQLQMRLRRIMVRHAALNDL